MSYLDGRLAVRYNDRVNDPCATFDCGARGIRLGSDGHVRCASHAWEMDAADRVTDCTCDRTDPATAHRPHTDRVETDLATHRVLMETEACPVERRVLATLLVNRARPVTA